MTKQWFQKRMVADAVLAYLEIQPRLFRMLSDKIHSDDLQHICVYLGTDQPTLVKVLYCECPPPGGAVEGLN